MRTCAQAHGPNLCRTSRERRPTVDATRSFGPREPHFGSVRSVRRRSSPLCPRFLRPALRRSSTIAGEISLRMRAERPFFSSVGLLDGGDGDTHTTEVIGMSLLKLRPASQRCSARDVLLRSAAGALIARRAAPTDCAQTRSTNDPERAGSWTAASSVRASSPCSHRERGPGRPLLSRSNC